MKLLVINWDDPGVFKVLSVAKDSDIDQNTLCQVQANDLDIFKTELDRTGVVLFRRLCVSDQGEPEEDDDDSPVADDGSHYEVEDWELVT